MKANGRLTRAQKNYQSIRRQERKHATQVVEMLSLASNLKAKTGCTIDDQQAKVLWNVTKTLQFKRSKGLL
jgi:hypothetical protein